jgi:hypothetical protein
MTAHGDVRIRVASPYAAHDEARRIASASTEVTVID